jgi:hypothetical protein
MAVWDELKLVIARLEGQEPGPLTRWPDPQAADGEPPFEIGLAAWATDAARQLHERFGSDVQLTVGALSYPQRLLTRSEPPAGAASAGELLHESDVVVALDGPLSVRTGHTAHHGLLVSNKTSRELQVNTGRDLIAEVVDPDTGAVVGGYSGAVFAMLQVFSADPGATVRIPLLVGTDSFVADLGYAIPPGRWGVQATLAPAVGRPGRIPVLPFTITS